jgi:uncharacterized paraquat-inducible protein A
MLMPFLVATALAVGLVQLGALSVWVTVLAGAFKLVLALAIAVALYFGSRMLWRKYLGRKQQGE